MNASTLVQKLWNYCNILRDDGLSYSDYDLFWLKDDSLSDSDNLPAPELIAAEIIEDLQAALDHCHETSAQ